VSELRRADLHAILRYRLGLDDGSDTVADAQVMDRSRGLGAVGRAHAINEGEPQRRPGRDLLPEF
jgi:type IV secretion system protein VirD4